jgi:hypothetical protein
MAFVLHIIGSSFKDTLFFVLIVFCLLCVVLWNVTAFVGLV